ncbi:MAG TPA: glycosyltransferase family 39 protein [Rhizomicrobium sp.]|nr:glycosyltransferase family 39 protein [Rhizomicrobium sp.]
MREHRPYVIAIVVLIALRFVAGAILPLSADEAYYWLWSRHLAAGYYDHPPTIAFLIRGGIMLFGDTSFGVRAIPLLLSVAASWFVWRAGAFLLKDERAGALSCLLFNLTLMVAVEMMAATPDAPLIACAAAFLWALAKVEDTEDGRWWLAVGAAGGLALLSKYTAFFLGAGALAWIVFTPSARRWLLSPWPYLGAILAFAIFAPNLWWNETHHWMTFAFQFGRVGTGHLTARFLFEFLGAQLLLATPFIFICCVFGLSRWKSEIALLVALILPSAIYFAIHSLHDRVQGNWPCFLYPALAIVAAAATRESSTRFPAVLTWSGRLAVPVAAMLLTLCYLQAFFDVAPIGRSDPFARLLGFGFRDAARHLDPGAAILTTDYETAAWFAFYGRQPVVQLNEEQRYLTAPAPDTAILARPLLYVAEQNRDHHDFVAAHFARVQLLGAFDRSRGGKAVAHYVVYRVTGEQGAAIGRVP